MQLAANGTAQHYIQAFSWMLLHSLWQGLLLAVITGLLLLFSKKASAAARYTLVFVQLLLFVAGCLATFMFEWDKAPVPGTGAYFVAGGVTPVLLIKTFADNCMSYFTANAPVIVLLWFVLFMFRSVRMLGSILFINRARHRFIYEPAEVWKEKLPLLCHKLQLKKAVQLLESGYVKVPMTFGHLRPLILLPLGLLAGLPPGQIEAVLLHELAHIRRNDYLVNLLQTIAETMFFFNPGLLWISSVLRDERENCCDDIALEQTKNKKEFVQALISFKEHSLSGAGYAVAFPGKSNHLFNRVSRIMQNKNRAFGTVERTSFMISLVILPIMIATVTIAQLRNVPVAYTAEGNAVYTPAPPAKQIKPAKSQLPEKHRLLIAVVKNNYRKKQDAKPLQEQTEPAVIKNNNEPPAKLALQQQAQSLTDQAQALKDQVQAEKDQQSAIADTKQAQLDYLQAQKDQAQAMLDQKQAEIDQATAMTAAKQTQIDQAAAQKNAMQIKIPAKQNKEKPKSDIITVQ